MIDLTKGSRTTLASHRYTVRLTAAGDDARLVDVAAVLLGPDRRVRDDGDIVFFNNPARPGAALADGAVAIDLDRIPHGVERIVVAGLTEPQDVCFDVVRAPQAVIEGVGEAYRLPLAGLTTETAVMLVAFYRRGGGWKLDAVGQGYSGGFAAFAVEHGIDVEDDDRAASGRHAQPPAPRVEARVVVPAPIGVVPTPAAAPVPAAPAPLPAPVPPPAPVPEPPTVSPEERCWHDLRARGDVDAAIETVLEAHDRGDVPDWLAQGRGNLTDELVTAITARLDDPRTPLGYQLIRLSSAGGDPSLALLGLASVCIQDEEQGGVVNEKIPSLLRSQLSLFDVLPRETFPRYVLLWRELAIRRVEILVRIDWARQVNAVRERYVEHVGMAQLVLVHEVARTHLASIRGTLPLLRDAHRDLSFYLPLLDHHDEKAQLAEDLELLENLIDAGVDTLNTPRR